MIECLIDELLLEFYDMGTSFNYILLEIGGYCYY